MPTCKMNMSEQGPTYPDRRIRIGEPKLRHARIRFERLSLPLLTILLLWPILTLIARQIVYFSGPSRDSYSYLYGTSRGSHLFLYLNYAILAAFVVVGWPGVWTRLKQNTLLTSTLVLALCSVLWTSSTQITVQMFVEISLCTLFACYLSIRLRTHELMQAMMAIGAIASLLSISFVIALPSYGIFAGYGTAAWQGICSHKNTLGISSAYLLLPAFFAKGISRGVRIAYAALLIMLVILSQSRGAWFDTFGVLCFVVWMSLYRHFRRKEAILFLLITGAVLMLLTALVIVDFPELATAVGKDSTMSGRFKIYEQVLLAIQKRPLLGYGLGGFWFPGSLESQRLALTIGWANIGYSENGFLELALQIGLLGVALVLSMLAVAILRGFWLLRTPFYTPRVGWFLSILILAMLTNIDAGWFLTSDNLDWLLIVIACIGLNDEWRHAVHFDKPTMPRELLLIRSEPNTRIGNPGELRA